MCSNRILGLGLIGFLAFITGSNAEIPSFIKVCKRADPELAKCINNSILELQPRLAAGIPSLDVPKLEPLLLDRISLNNGPEALGINANFSNIRVYGPSNFQVERLVPNVNKNTYKFKLQMPKLYFTGNYEMDMRILAIAIKGKGLMVGNLTNYGFDCIIKGNKVQKDGQEYLEFEKMKLRINVGSTKLYLDNLFNGDPILGRATNEVINENSVLFVKEILPSLSEALSKKLTEIANKITLRFTYDELFL